MHLSAEDVRPWDEIPLVVLTGIVLGLVLIWAAIRFWFRKK